MKKLNRLYINPEKVMKNDELITLRGGYGSGTDAAVCRKFWYSEIITLGSVCVTSCNSEVALDECQKVYPETSFAQCLSVPC